LKKCKGLSKPNSELLPNGTATLAVFFKKAELLSWRWKTVTLDVNNALRYLYPMILSFSCKETEKLARGRFSRKLPTAIQHIAARKLKLLNDSVELNDLRVPPANRLEALKGSRKGQHSIRINDQWRICFRWNKGNASDVAIVDYH
jgi:toxin HigB-1